MALQLAMCYMSSHASACYFLIRHGGVVKPTLTGPQKYWFPRLTKRRSRITSTVIYYLVRSFVYLAYNNSINSLYMSHVATYVARCEKHENFWITFICKISIAKILILCLTVKYTCRESFLVYGIISKTTCSSSATLSDISQCSVAQLACSSAKVLHRHPSSLYLVTVGSKGIMAKCLHDALHIWHMHGAIDHWK